MVTEENMGWLCVGHRYKHFGAVLPTTPWIDTKDKTNKFYIPKTYHPSAGVGMGGAGTGHHEMGSHPC